MATLIPSLGAARFDARGELRLAERLKDCLEDNAWVWHNIPVGPFGRHPDFVALHPQQGIVVLEVKDWRLDTIVNANSKQVELLTDRGRVQSGRVGTVPTQSLYNPIRKLIEFPAKPSSTPIRFSGVAATQGCMGEGGAAENGSCE